MPTPFLVFFQGRSGSTLLIEALQSHPNVLARGEMLIALGYSGDLQTEWAKSYFTRKRPPSCAAVGFKTKLTDVVNRQLFASVLRETNCSIVHVNRANVVKQVISWIRAELLFQRTAEWNVYSAEDRLHPVHIDEDDFLLRLKAIEQGKSELKRYVEELDLPTIEISYEQLLVAAELSFDTVLRFLGVPQQQLRPRCIKATEDDLRFAVTNLSELRAKVADTTHQNMLDEILALKRNSCEKL